MRHKNFMQILLDPGNWIKTKSRPADGSLLRCGSLFSTQEGCHSASYTTISIIHWQHLLFGGIVCWAGISSPVN